MCGIVGFIEKVGIPRKTTVSTFEALLYVDAIRGWDATGVFTVNTHNNAVKSIKRATIPTNLLYIAEKEKFSFQENIVIGHNRAATKGKATEDKYAHPFTHEHITLVHNGTLINHRTLDNTEVDSEAICKYLVNNTPQDLVENAWGAYALIWYDSKTKELNILRNEERPLWILETEDTYYFSSEVAPAKWLLEKNKEKIIKHYTAEPYILYTFTKNKGKTVLHTTNVKQKEKVNSHIASYHSSNKEVERVINLLKAKQITESSTILIEVYNATQYNKQSWWKHTAKLVGTNLTCCIWNKDKLPNTRYKATYKTTVSATNKEGYEIICTNAKNFTTTITPKVHTFLQGRTCLICKKNYTSDRNPEEAYISVVEENEHIYGYTYICSACNK